MRPVALASGLLLLILAPALSHAQPPRIDRLERLERHLRTVPPAKFDVTRWGNGTDPDSADYVGCVGGHATAIPEFAAAGLHLERWFGTTHVDVRYRDKWGHSAIIAFFGLDGATESRLFSNDGHTPDEFRDPLAYAGAIRGVIREERARLAMLRAGGGVVVAMEAGR